MRGPLCYRTVYPGEGEDLRSALHDFTHEEDMQLLLMIISLGNSAEHVVPQAKQEGSHFVRHICMYQC